MYYMPPRWEGGMSSADELRIDPARGPRAAAALAVELALEKSSDRKLSMLHVHDTVFSAVDAEIGLTIAHAELPNLILMDIQLPGMDGLEATALLRAHDATRAIPVIALTALAMNGDEERIRAAGCDGYIAKPMSVHGFLATVAAKLISVYQAFCHAEHNGLYR